MNAPIIKHAPSEAEINRLVDTLIEPANADKESSALATLLMSVAEEGSVGADIAQIACRRAYEKTSLFERSFNAFTGFVRPMAEPEAIELGNV